MKKVLFSITIVAIIVIMAACGNTGNHQQIQPAEGVSVAEQWDVSVSTTDLEVDTPRYEAIIRDAKGKTIQVVKGNTNAYRPIELLKPFGNVWQADVDFDGYTDIMICMGIQPLLGYKTYYDAWIFNPQTGKFDYHEGLSDLNNPEVDTIRKCVTYHYPLDSVTEQYTAVSVQKNGMLKELKSWQKKVIPYK